MAELVQPLDLDPRIKSIYDVYGSGQKFGLGDVADLLNVPLDTAEDIVNELQQALSHVPEAPQLNKDSSARYFFGDNPGPDA